MFEHFIQAQSRTLSDTLKELQNGKKTTHWMWWTFPQLKELGTSENSNKYGLESLEQAVEYWSTPILRARLSLFLEYLLIHSSNSMVITDIFSSTDSLKLRSCCTLFHLAQEQSEHKTDLFKKMLDTWFHGEVDQKTLKLLGRSIVAPTQDKQARVGVVALVINQGKVLLGRRLSKHAHGTWGAPGGHLEFGESFVETARRETLEETGIQLVQPQLLTVTNDVYTLENKHYVTVFMWERVDSSTRAQLLEPGKCEGWYWFNLTGDELPKPLMPCLISLFKGFYPVTLATLTSD